MCILLQFYLSSGQGEIPDRRLKPASKGYFAGIGGIPMPTVRVRMREDKLHKLKKTFYYTEKLRR